VGGAKTQEIEEIVRWDQREEEVQATIYRFTAVLLMERRIDKLSLYVCAWRQKPKGVV
jgi:hypothetical protein